METNTDALKEMGITEEEWPSIKEKPIVKQIDNIRITIEYHPQKGE